MNYSREGTNENKSLPGPSHSSHHGSLPGSHRGPFTGINFDAEAGPASSRDSEPDQNVRDSFDRGTMYKHPVGSVHRDILVMHQELQAKKTKNTTEKKQEIKPCERTLLLDYNKHQNENLSAISEPIAPSGRILKKHAETYELEKYKKKAMIIFNHQHFLGGTKSTRHGTLQDEEALKATFEMFGFEVEAHLDLTKKALLNKLELFCMKDFTEYGCVCAAVLTHGSMPDYLCAYDTRYREHELREFLNAHFNPTLFGKPIIILIQACRGDMPATACRPATIKFEMNGPVIDSDLLDDQYNLPTESDMLIFHSSYFGRASVRDVRYGSWFIQTLCKQIKLLAATTHFEGICIAVRREVALYKEHDMMIDNKPAVAKQMPVVTSTLIRPLYLRKYCDRADTDEDEEYSKEMPQDEVPRRRPQVDLQNTDISHGSDSYLAYMKQCLSMSDPDALQDFQQSVTAELNWLEEKEQVELSRDWASPYINLPAVQHYYEQLMSSLEKRELQFSNVIDRGEALIAQHHPATKTIECHLQAMQSQWAWVLQLTLCLEIQLKHTTQYHNFFEEVKKAEKWIQEREEAINFKTYQSEFTLDHGESLLKDMQELRKEIDTHGTVVTRLINETQTIRPVKQRRPRDPVTRPLRAETVCAYKHANVVINKGSAVMVVDNFGRSHWLVRLGDAGTETYLPGAVIALSPPCTDAQDAATKLRKAYDRVIQLWQKKQIRVRQNMMFVTFKVVKGWDFRQFVTIDSERRQSIRQALNEDAEKLLAEGDPADPKLRRLRREIDDINRLFDEPERRVNAEGDG